MRCPSAVNHAGNPLRKLASDAFFGKIAKTLDKAAKKTGVNFIGGYTALVHKDYTNGERILIESITEAHAAADLVC